MKIISGWKVSFPGDGKLRSVILAIIRTMKIYVRYSIKSPLYCSIFPFIVQTDVPRLDRCFVFLFVGNDSTRVIYFNFPPTNHSETTNPRLHSVGYVAVHENELLK